MERIGELVPTLKFYEGFWENKKSELKKFAQERWLKTKSKQADYHSSKNETNKSEDIKLEIQDKASSWGITENIDQLNLYPVLNRLAVLVRGLPADIKEERLEGGNVKFQIGNIEVQTDRSKTRVTIENTDTENDLKVNWTTGKLTGDAETTEQPVDKNTKSFEVAASQYEGTLLFGSEKPNLKLKIQNQPPIELEL
jgi:hypothetical protein